MQKVSIVNGVNRENKEVLFNRLPLVQHEREEQLTDLLLDFLKPWNGL